VKGVERTFATYYELQDHLYKDHDMTKDPAMEIFAKRKSLTPKHLSPTDYLEKCLLSTLGHYFIQTLCDYRY